MRPQLASLAHGAHIVVGTPGRILDHLERGSLPLDALNTLVLDEADRMLDMGFADDIAAVAAAAPSRGRRCCSRPPTPRAWRKLSARFLRDPKEVTLAARHRQQDPPALL
jgi:ATP-independent RNA helicase DbpA